MAVPGTDFARTAAGLIEAGKPVDALRLCREGTDRFPRYATGYLILGMAYQALDRRLEALLEFERALAILPDRAGLRKRVEELRRSEEESYQAFATEQSTIWSGPRGTKTISEYQADKPAEKGTVEFLLEQAHPQPVEEPPPETPGDAPTTNVPKRIVTPTLAEIYASQGEYAEAIAAYTALVALRPADADRFTSRIGVLRELERMKSAENKGPTDVGA